MSLALRLSEQPLMSLISPSAGVYNGSVKKKKKTGISLAGKMEAS